MKKHLTLFFLLFLCLSSNAQQCTIYPFGILNIDPTTMKQDHIRSFEVDCEYYMVNNEKGNKKRNRKLSKEYYKIKYLVNDSGFVHGFTMGKEKDSMIITTHQPLPWDPSIWIPAGDSMVVDSPFIYFYDRIITSYDLNDRSRTLRYTKKFNWKGQMIYFTNYIGNKQLSETEYYYTGDRLDSSVVNPDGWNKTVNHFVYDKEYKRVEQVLTYHTIMEDYVYAPLELYSIATYSYEAPGLIKEVRIVTPLKYSIHWVITKVKWDRE